MIERLSKYNKLYGVMVIALVHLVLALYGMVLTVNEIVVEQKPFQMFEVNYVIFYYLIHFILISLLVMGTKNMSPLLYIPWLLVFMAVFTTATCFWIESVSTARTIYIVPLITNVVILGLGWLSWFTVGKEFLFLLLMSKTRFRIAIKS